MKRNSLILWDAIKRGDLSTIKQILDSNFPIDTPVTDTGMTAFAFACSWSSKQDVFTTLLTKRPNVNAPDKSKKTPLHQAALAGNMVALNILAT